MKNRRWLAAAAIFAGGCLGLDPATESNEGSAVSADGRRIRLITRNRGWDDGRQTYQLYSKIPYVSASSVTIMGLRLALPARWPDNTPVSLYTLDARWWTDAEMALVLYHRPEGTNTSWVPLRCSSTSTGAGALASDLQYFHASQALIDLQSGELELVPVAASGSSASAPGAFERDPPRRYEDDGYGDGAPVRDTRSPANVTVSTFAQCGISETNPEFSAFVFPYSVRYWEERFEYDFSAACDGDPCPAYRGDPNEPRRSNNNNGGGVPGNNNNGGYVPGNNNGGVVNQDPYRTAWDVTDDSTWQCGRTNVVGAGNVSSVRVDVRGRHGRTSDLDASIKKVGGLTNVTLFSTNSGQYFPISRTVATSNELWAGTWELCVRDSVRGELGRVDGWSVTLDQAGLNPGNNNNGGGLQPGVVAVTAGSTRNDSIENNVQDWFSISLTQGQTLSAATSGSCTDTDNGAAPVVSIHSQLPVNRPQWSTCPAQNDANWTGASTLGCSDEADDYCTSTSARAPATGTYYVRVIGYDNEYPGTYSISFTVR